MHTQILCTDGCLGASPEKTSSGFAQTPSMPSPSPSRSKVYLLRTIPGMGSGCTSNLAMCGVLRLQPGGLSPPLFPTSGWPLPGGCISQVRAEVGKQSRLLRPLMDTDSCCSLLKTIWLDRTEKIHDLDWSLGRHRRFTATSVSTSQSG